MAARSSLLDAAARPIHGASIAVFRIAFGVAMLVDVFLYLPVLVSEYYVDTTFTFAYDPWGLVRPLPGPFTMHLVYLGMAVTAGLIIVGLWYRVAAATFFLLTTYVFLIDSTYFQNHEYLICMLSFVLIFLPTHRMWSMDARRRPEIASDAQPAWILWFLRFQIGVPYFFGGIAKLNADWLQGEPLRMWLANRTHVEVIGRHFTNEGVVWFANYGSLLLDLTIVGFLLNRRTRMPAFLIATTFHLLNARLFGLFVFPWLMIAATTLFFEPDWPLRLRAWWRARRSARTATIGDSDPRGEPVAATVGAATLRAATASTGVDTGAGAGAGGGSDTGEVAGAGAQGTADEQPRRGVVGRGADGGAISGADGGVGDGAISDADGDDPSPPPATTFDGTVAADGGQRRLARGLAGFLAVWIAIQVLVPLRHLAIPGDANWTEEGHRFAWHMMLRTKSGSVTFVVDDGQQVWTEDPYDHLGDKQATRLAGHPERLARFAHHLSDLYGGAEVRAETSVALNGREPVPIVDPELDLSTVQVPWWGHADWILPNPEPLRRD